MTIDKGANLHNKAWHRLLFSFMLLLLMLLVAYELSNEVSTKNYNFVQKVCTSTPEFKDGCAAFNKDGKITNQEYLILMYQLNEIKPH